MKKLAVILAVVIGLTGIVGCGEKEPVEQAPVAVETVEPAPAPEKEIQEVEPEAPAPPEVPVPEAETTLEPEEKPVENTAASVDSSAFGNILEMATLNPELMIYVPVNSANFATAISSVEKITTIIKDTAPDNSVSPVSRFSTLLVINKDYGKTTYSTFSNGVKVNDDFYPVPAGNDDTLMGLYSESSSPTAYAQWLYWIKTSRAFSLEIVAPDGTLHGATNAYEITEFVRKLEVAPLTFRKSAKLNLCEVPSTVNITFDSGVIYNVNIAGDTLNISTSDMSYSCVYTLMEPAKALAGLNRMITDYSGPIKENGEPLEEGPVAGKPVIYLYPEKEQNVKVKLDFKGKLTYTFPSYNTGWNVTAKPDGTITNLSDGTTHYYLFWEGVHKTEEWDFSKGFVVAGKDTGTFFEEILPKTGLTPKEYNDFIVFWTPLMQDNPYNLITFATTEYEELAKLDITPKPDSILRVHMVFKPLEKSTDANPTPQTFTSFKRDGFTVVEWGGTNLGTAK